MKTLTVKLDEDILAETWKLAADMNIDRDRYINEALRKFNTFNRRRLLQQASKATSAESMSVPAEFEALEDDYEDYAT